MTNWLSKHNQGEDKVDIKGMNLNFNAIETCADIPECIMLEEIRHATQQMIT